MTEPTSDAAWFHAAMVRIAAARHAGDRQEVDRLLAYIEGEGSPNLRRLAEQAIARAEDVEARQAAGEPLPVYPVGMNLPGQLLCDFCAAPDPVVYFPFNEFSLVSTGGGYLSGDRMYACIRCRHYVDTGDWKGLREWVGPTARGEGVRLLWMGFRQNRTGPAVEIQPGTNPEEDRKQQEDM